jgi:DNA-binding transcriptional regulator YdaS (Cro superfamily)
MPKHALEKAIALLGLTGLARALGDISAPGVAKWLKNGVPRERCTAIEAATSGAVRCEDLRPEVDWLRDDAGVVTGYHVRVDAPNRAEAA